MWQRIQTIFLLIAAAAAIAFIFLPLAEFEGNLFYAKNDIISSAIAVAIALLNFFIISQYKDRKLQLRFCAIVLVLSIALMGASILAATKYSEYVRFEFAAGIPVLIIIAVFMARRNIKKDDDLVKSMDRFR
ncbi:MAG: DUF4293 family protein [Chitinophagales bacterium]